MAVDFHKSITFDIMSAEIAALRKYLGEIIDAWDQFEPDADIRAFALAQSVGHAAGFLSRSDRAAREKAKPFDDVLG